ncbi:hypothetical protein CAPTEDRAFT_210308 [Capitella teleta]|uniref:CABIT domain-containing protein n=1 Tax=Capitella teleta TaxID=283909 RepID=N1PB38_CAPTE|nr:hypothetical protein CAPTEDRAFT_210308 [Capitella teleta]|eukprot:ELU18837.1 hypothetical protein CAPTEDRAFT_210308 [Capitella teleta]
MEKFALQEFVELFPSPQSGRIAESSSPGFDPYDAFDIPRGAVCKFKRKVNPSIELSFCEQAGSSNREPRVTSVEVPLECPARFFLLPFDPVSRDDSPDHIYHAVADLIEAFPISVQANCSYGRNDDENKHGFDCGDRFRLNRLVYRDGVRFLECRLLDDGRLRLLPFDAVGDFTVLPDDTEHTLADIAALPPRKRRLQFASNALSVPGLPPTTNSGDLFAEEPESFIEASLPDGVIIGLPSDIDMDVIPDESTFERGQLLNTFSTNNRSLFPVVARVVDWDEETSILENHFIRPGVELVIHGWTRQSKVIARCNEQNFAIPLTYQGKFRIQPRRFGSVSELERVYPGHKIRCLHVDDQDFPLVEGDVFRIRRTESIHKGFTREIQSLKCEKIDELSGGKGREVKLPINAQAVFEEVLEGVKADQFVIRDMVDLVTDQEVVVNLVSRSADQKHPDRDLPLHQTITLTDFVVEPAVYASVELPDAPAFHVPLRTHLYVVFVEQLERNCSPLLTKKSPKLSTLDRSAEVISQETYASLRPHQTTVVNSDYDQGGRMEPTPQHWQATAYHSGYSTAPRENTTTNDNVTGRRSRSGSFSESEIVVSKSKGFGSKLKGKFSKKHRSSENLFKDRDNEVSSRNGDVTYGTPNLDLNVETKGPPASPTVSIPADHADSVFTDDAGQSTSLSSTSSPMHSPAPRQPASPPIRMHAAFDANHPLPSRSTSAQDVSHEKKPRPPRHHGSMPSVQMNGAPFVVGLPGQHGTNDGEGVPSQQTPGLMLPPGYALIPMGMPNNMHQPQSSPIPPGYALVPMLPQMFNNMMNFNQQPQQNGTSTHKEDSSSDEEMTSNFAVKKGAQFKVVLPNDGNLYHFSAKKMSEFLRQLKMEPAVIKNCLKNKIDGKKFSQMQESDMERYGIFHPVVAHFRSLTFKNKSSSSNGSISDLSFKKKSTSSNGLNGSFKDLPFKKKSSSISGGSIKDFRL